MSMPKRMSVFAALLGTTSASTCQELCENLEACAQDPQAHGSYCKTWNSLQTCFGLFYRDEALSTMCFQPNDPTCPQNHPVICPELPDSTTVEPTREPEQTPLSDPKKQPTTCQEICDDVDACREDPQAHGSYCKFMDSNPICLGLYHDGASKKKICFQPNDGECPETDPVSCPTEEVDALVAAVEALSTSDTTDAPNTCQEVCETITGCRDDPHAHGSYCKFQDHTPICFGLYHTDESKTDLCFQPTDSDCSEKFPVSCPEDEVRRMAASASATEPTCQQLCDGLTECREDPQDHGSYCKTWGNPSPVCFGMYYTSAAKDKLCYQPNNKSCPNKYPVYCAV